MTNENQKFIYGNTENSTEVSKNSVETKYVICKKVKKPSKNSIYVRLINGEIKESNRLKYRHESNRIKYKREK